MRPFALRYSFALSVTALLAACGGGGGSTLHTYAIPTVAPQTATPVTFNILVPAASAPSVKRGQYVSSASQSISIQLESVNGGVAQSGVAKPTIANLTPGSAGCAPATGGGTTCTITASGATGSDMFVLEAYSGTNGTGSQLSAGVINVVVGASNGTSSVPAAAVNVALAGTPSSMSLAVSPSKVTAGVKTSVNVALNVIDAKGNIILGPPALQNPLQLLLADAANEFTVEENAQPLTLTASGYLISSFPANGLNLTLAYNGGLNRDNALLKVQSAPLPAVSAEVQVPPSPTPPPPTGPNAPPGEIYVANTLPQSNSSGFAYAVLAYDNPVTSGTPDPSSNTFTESVNAAKSTSFSTMQSLDSNFGWVNHLAIDPVSANLFVDYDPQGGVNYEAQVAELPAKGSPAFYTFAINPTPTDPDSFPQQSVVGVDSFGNLYTMFAQGNVGAGSTTGILQYAPGSFPASGQQLSAQNGMYFSGPGQQTVGINNFLVDIYGDVLLNGTPQNFNAGGNPWYPIPSSQLTNPAPTLALSQTQAGAITPLLLQGTNQDIALTPQGNVIVVNMPPSDLSKANTIQPGSLVEYASPFANPTSANAFRQTGTINTSFPLGATGGVSAYGMYADWNYVYVLADVGGKFEVFIFSQAAFSNPASAGPQPVATLILKDTTESGITPGDLVVAP